MRFFVTGATGFIGRHLCQRLTSDGHEVVALARSSAKVDRLPKNVEVFQGDLGRFADPSTVLPPCDIVVHLAGVVAADKLEEYDAVNFKAVEDLLGCLARQSWKPRRFLFASSLAAAGPSPANRPWTEADAPAPIEPYGDAKARAEAIVARASFPTTSFRPPSVFGPEDPATLTLFRSARAGFGFRVSGAPQRLSFVDVRDLVQAIVLMADDRRSGSFVYFASHPRPIDVPELWRELGNAVGRRVRVVPIPRAGLYAAMRIASLGQGLLGYKNQLDSKQYQQMVAPAFVCSSEALRRDLGFSPRHDLSEALKHAADGYRAARMLAG
jgi:nucleoside-diphosphate-sugar epimerase